jgi:hypothetical protein
MGRPPSPGLFAPQTVFDYHRTIIGYHGTRQKTADKLVNGDAFGPSTNDDDWLGHGIYFWEYAPQHAWWWAQRRYGAEGAVVGASIRLGRCLDLLDPANADLLRTAHADMIAVLEAAKVKIPKNANTHKYLDCAVFRYLYAQLEKEAYRFDSSRAVFVPLTKTGGMDRLWERSGIFRGGHIQVCLREPRNILAVWSVRKDGRYGRDE